MKGPALSESDNVDVVLCETAEFVEVSVGSTKWQDADGRYFEVADYRVSGEIWRVHKSDADPYPSNPHAHCVDGAKRFIGRTLHLGTGELFDKRKGLGRYLEKHQFERLLELIRPKFPDLTFPLPG